MKHTRKSPSRRVLLASGVLLLLALSLIAALTAWHFAPQFVPQWLQEKILTSVHDSCPKCQMEIGETQIDFTNRTISFSDLHYVDAPGHHSQVNVKVKNLVITLDIKKLLKKQILIRELDASGIDFTLYEDARIHSPPDNTPPLSALPALVIRNIKVTESKFQYIHQIDLHDPKKEISPARLLLTAIHGTMGAWSSRKYLSEAYHLKRTPIEAEGILERSGTFEVKAEADPLSEKGTVHLSVTVKDQPLQRVNDFFPFEAGFKMEGQLFSVATVLDMNEGKIQGLLHARYSGLNIQVVDPKSSGVSNFLATLGTKVVINREQGVNGKPEGKSLVEHVRRADQSLLSAIFQGLGKSAKELVTH